MSAGAFRPGTSRLISNLAADAPPPGSGPRCWRETARPAPDLIPMDINVTIVLAH